MKLSYLSWRTCCFTPGVVVCLLAASCLVLTATSTAAAASTWDMVFPAGVGNVASVWFADSQIGVVGGSGGHGFFGTGEDVAPIAYTRDGGKTWGNAWLDRPTIKHAGFLQLLNTDLGCGIGSDEEGSWLLRTEDGGKTWRTTPLPEEPRPTELWFADESNAWLFARGHLGPQQLRRTTNGGRTWEPLDLADFKPDPNWRPLLFVPASREEFYLVGNFDYLLHTTNGGGSFNLITVDYQGPRDYLSIGGAAVAPDGETIYLVGGQYSAYTENWRPPKQAVIVQSPDGGQTWEEQDPQVVNSLRCVVALSAQEAWAGGFGGYGLTPWVPGVLLHTVDGGKSWKNESPSQVSVRGIYALNRDTLWAVGGQGGSPHETNGVVISYRPEEEGERPEGHIAIKYAMPAAGYASLVIKDSQGRQVRTLLAHSRREAGPQTDYWDGLDDDGLPVLPGRYSWKLLTHQGITAEYVMSYNCPNQPSWRTVAGTGGWAGDQGAPTSLCAVGDKMVLGFGGGEAQPAAIVVDLEGRRTGISGKGWPLALATDGANIYSVGESFADYSKRDDPQVEVVSKITRWEAATGRFAYFEKREATREVHRWTLDQTEPEPFISERLERGLLGPEFSGHTHNQIHLRTTNMCGLACGDGKVFASLRREDKVLVLDEACQKLGEFSVLAPVGLAFRDGVLYVVSGTTVRRYDDFSDLDSVGEEGTVVVQGLVAPFAITLDPQGNLYVSDWGNSMQVKVFSASSELLRILGKLGGRAWLGEYDPTGFLKPRALAIDAQGRLWVADDDEPIKRVSLWNPDGTLYQDLIGAGRYAQYSWMYPDDAHTAYTAIYGVTSYTVDLEQKTWTPQAVLFREGWHPLRIGPMLPFFRTQGADGRDIYITSTRSGSLGLAERRDGLLYPLMAVGWAPDLIPPDLEKGWNQPFNPVMRKRRTDFIRHGGWYDEHGSEVCLWIDRNRDGLYQEEELSFTILPGWDNSGARHNPPAEVSWGQWIAPDLTLYLATGYVPGQIWRWPLAGWDENNLPLYRPEDIELVLEIPHHSTGALTVGPSGIIVTESKLEAYSPQGKLLWRYPHQWSGMAFQAPFGKPGLAVGTQAFCGWVDDMVMVTGYFGQFNVLTEEGLYVAQLLKDMRVGGSLDAYSIACENFSGLWFRDQNTGKVYLVVGGGVDSRIFEINGLEAISRVSGDLNVTGADIDQARAAAAARVAAETVQGPKQAFIRKISEPLSLTRGLDDRWKELPPVAEVLDSPSTGYTVRAAHDGQSLYLAYEVRDGSPMVNRGDDFRLLFKTGDAVDLMLGPVGQRNEPRPGDLRLLMSVMDGKPIAVLYRPLMLAGQEPAPASFASASRVIPMERVSEEPDLELNVFYQANKYVLKVRIPFELLAVEYTPGLMARGDFGVVYSDLEGSRNVYRSYWANTDPTIAIVNDVPSEAVLKPAGWGSLMFQ